MAGIAHTRAGARGRTEARRTRGAPGLLVRAGGMLALTLRVLTALARPPFAWRRETALFTVDVLRRTGPAIALSISLSLGCGVPASNALAVMIWPAWQ